MKWMQGLIGLVLILATAQASPAVAQADARLPSRLEVGVYVGPQSDISGVGEVGLRWVKYRVELTRDNLAEVPTRITAANKLGLKVLLQVMGDRARAGDATYWKEYAAQAATLAQANPNAIEIWHYQNLDREFGGSGTGKVSPESYVGLLREAYGAIKAANKNVIVISGAPAATGFFGGACTAGGCDDKPFIERMSAVGAARYMDCLGVAVYGSPNAPDMRRGGPTGDHPVWYFLPMIEVSTKAFRNAKPVCLTGVGYVSKEGVLDTLPGGWSWGNNITVADQATWLAQAVVVARRSRNVRLMVIANWDLRGYISDADSAPNPLPNSPMDGSLYSIVRPNGSCLACLGLRGVLIEGKTAPFG